MKSLLFLFLFSLLTYFSSFAQQAVVQNRSAISVVHCDIINKSENGDSNILQGNAQIIAEGGVKIESEFIELNEATQTVTAKEVGTTDGNSPKRPIIVIDNKKMSGQSITYNYKNKRLSIEDLKLEE